MRRRAAKRQPQTTTRVSARWAIFADGDKTAVDSGSSGRGITKQRYHQAVVSPRWLWPPHRKGFGTVPHRLRPALTDEASTHSSLLSEREQQALHPSHRRLRWQHQRLHSQHQQLRQQHRLQHLQPQRQQELQRRTLRSSHQLQQAPQHWLQPSHLQQAPLRLPPLHLPAQQACCSQPNRQSSLHKTPKLIYSRVISPGSSPVPPGRRTVRHCLAGFKSPMKVFPDFSVFPLQIYRSKQSLSLSDDVIG